MTAPTFLVETALGPFALTVVDEHCIIARSAPGDGSRDEEIQVVFHQASGDAWWPRTEDDVLALRRGIHRGRGRTGGMEVLDLQPGVIAALSEVVTEWASACPLLLETAGAMSRQSTGRPFPGDS